MKNLDISSYMCRHVVCCAWSSSLPILSFSWKLQSVYLSLFYRAHNFFTLSMVFAMLWKLVYRETLISTKCCTSENVTFQLEQQYQVYTVGYKKTKSVSFLLQLIHVIISHLHIVCIKRKKEELGDDVPSHFSNIRFCLTSN